MSPRLSELFLSSQSDERLVALARAGQERAFVAIVERYRPEMQALARRLCTDGRAEDVVQQAFLSAFAALRSGAEVAHLRGWLYRIVRNAAYRSRRPQCIPLDGATASAETVEDVVQQRVIAMSALTELARLPARQRQAMVGTVGGMSRSEVASTMGLSDGAVRQLVRRARSTLRTAVTAVTPWPMARWFAGIGQSAPGSVELAAGAGAASSGGIMLKLGALVASGTLATGVAAVDLHGARVHRPAARSATPGHARASTHRAGPLVLAAVDPSLAVAAAGSPQRSAGARIIDVSQKASHAGPVAEPLALRRGRHETSHGSSGTRHDGSRRPDSGSGGHESGSGGHESGSGGHESGSGGHESGSGGHESGSGGHDSGTSAGGRDGSGGRDGAGGPSQSGHGDSSPSGSGSGHGSSGGGHDSGGSVSTESHQDRADQTLTQSVMLGSGGDGSRSNQVSGSGDGSGSGDSGGSGSTSGGGSGSSSGSGSG
jgi:RNA polymerase sigma factor (sigma-70 family)